MLTGRLIYQLGTESTWGTPVTPTVQLIGVTGGNIKDNIQGEVEDDMIGRLGPSNIAVVFAANGSASCEGHALYEDINYPLESMFGAVSPNGTGPYTRTGAAPLANASPTNPRSFTFYKGDSVSGKRLEGALVNSLTLTGNSKGYLDYSYSMIGQVVSDGTPAALGSRTVNKVMGSQASLFIDAVGGTVGSTAAASTAFRYELTLNGPRELQTYLGNLTPTDWNENKFSGTLKLDMKYDATAATSLITSMLDKSTSTPAQRQIRIVHSNGANLDLRFDFAGSVIEGSEYFNDLNGLVTISVTLQGTYNTAMGNWFAYRSVNSVSALP